MPDEREPDRRFPLLYLKTALITRGFGIPRFVPTPNPPQKNSQPMNAPDGSRVETRKLDHALVGGFAWTAGAKWLSQLVAWPAVLINAKLLSPGDFGLTEMAGFYFVVTN